MDGDVTFEIDEKWGTVVAIFGKREIAGICEEDDGEWSVTWGSGGNNMRRFPSRQAAEQFVEDNAGDIDDGVWV